MRIRPLAIAALAAPLVASNVWAQGATVTGDAGTTLSVAPVTDFNEPWAMTFLPDGNLLVTEKSGVLLIVSQDGEKTEVSGVPEVAYGGQGGLGDVVLHPDFSENNRIYISFAEPGEGNTRGAAVASATLVQQEDSASLEDVDVIWRQQPKVTGEGHYSHRIAFAPDGEHLFITSGERQKQTPAQDMDVNLGKIIRLNPDGSVPQDNPFQDQGELAKTFWSVGHRNMLGIAFDGQGRLWAHEMGPRGGDELNLVERGENYGWPVVSNGRNYGGSDIPDHPTRPEFEAPEAFWNPVISPAGLVIYSGDVFPEWQGDALIGGLSGRAIIHAELGEQEDGTLAAEAERFDMGARIREVEQGPDGALWALEDRAGGRLLKLMPADAD
ncbi:PQQ-dependent sugar dehydrogenase [Aquibium oceanicum]|uniref:Glucose dehydrogenase n=1 Tax=Aquibium oceanicum TaxID=1670800 RepID=A0A1L3SV95_9HYPH|nr:PQQ-dependent sugar dehydrogenase [Aquibium oceanicum]APH73346.1 glucose dehydrogenase [Aquibium oceanicum]